ncbi:uncharacterized protein [Parasteatoda tepidariorum]|uniref:uncharacterized protein n=1 Tax=Parasteatoda tepidariorum TaxID=114398 RepID=UPI0039BC6DC3
MKRSRCEQQHLTADPWKSVLNYSDESRFSLHSDDKHCFIERENLEPDIIPERDEYQGGSVFVQHLFRRRFPKIATPSSPGKRGHVAKTPECQRSSASSGDKLLVRLEEHEPEQAQSQDEECAICISAKATMQTFPCGHKVVCRRCFVKTIQMAVSQRLLPLRCVMCRAKILKLKQLTSNHKHGVTLREEFPTSARVLNSPCSKIQGNVYRTLNRPVRKLYIDSPDILNQLASHSRPISSPRVLLAIPEGEELELVNSVQERCPEEWPADPLKVAKDPLVVKWLSRFRQFKPPSIIKGIKNRWRK